MLGLPASCYLDPATAAAERAQIFDRSWQFVCHASDLPAAGTAIRFDSHGRSSVVLRGKDGQLHGFVNACRHRGSRLVDGDAHTGLAFCVDARLRCPYHGWTYDETGALCAVPGNAGGTDAAQGTRGDMPPAAGGSAAERQGSTALRELHVQEWLGLVFMAHDPPALGLAATLGAVAKTNDPASMLALRRLNEPRLHPLRADWKLACEHLLDVSHWAVARPALKPRIFTPTPLVPEGDAVARAAAGLDEGAASNWWPARAYAKWLPGTARRTVEALFIWPNLLLQFMPDQLGVLQVVPGPTGSCALREVAYGIPDASRELRLLRYLASRLRRRARAQDTRILERVQEGLATGEPDFAGQIAADELGLRWFAERVRAAGIDGAAARPVRRRRQRAAPAAAVPDATN